MSAKVTGNLGYDGYMGIMSDSIGIMQELLKKEIK